MGHAEINNPDFFSRSSFDQMIWKKFFSLIEFSINEKRTWFFCVIFALRKKVMKWRKSERERKKRNSGRPDTWSLITHGLPTSSPGRFSLALGGKSALGTRLMDYTSPHFYSGIYVALVTLIAYPVSTCAAKFIHSFIHFILPLTRNTTTVYRNTLKIIYNIPTKLFTRLNVVKARKPI